MNRNTFCAIITMIAMTTASYSQARVNKSTRVNKNGTTIHTQRNTRTGAVSQARCPAGGGCTVTATNKKGTHQTHFGKRGKVYPIY